MPEHLTLFGRAGCHLCQDMAAALDEFQSSLDFDYRVIDVDEDPLLAERYGALVPVLARGEHPVCHYFLDLAALKAALAAGKAPRSE